MKTSLLLTSALLVLGTTAYAGDIKISGFATAAGGYIDDNTVGTRTTGQGVPTDTVSLGHGGYNSDYVEFQPDSVAGLQISSRLTDKMSFTMQIIGRLSNTASTVNLEWAYIKYDFTDYAAIQVGRYRPAIYLYSSTLDVGYSYLWIAPPSEVYGQVPMTYSDGANVLLNHTFDNDMTIEASAYFSNVNQDLPIGGVAIPFEFNNLMGTELSVSNDYFKLRAGYLYTKINATFGAPVDTTPALSVKDSVGTFSSIGLTVDYEDVLFVGEYAVRTVEESIFADEGTSYYATLGYRMGNFTPHITYSALDTSDYGETGNPALDVPKSAQASDSETITAGLRYEVNPQTALKVEYQNIKITPRDVVSNPTLDESDANLYKLAISVIF